MKKTILEIFQKLFRDRGIYCGVAKNFFDVFETPFVRVNNLIYFFFHYSDVNECERFTPCGVGNKCDNLIGSYVCTCGAGYRASPDARACVDEGRSYHA